MSKKSKLALYAVSSALLILVLYILFHESGHLIVMLSAGAEIDDFSILGAHVSAHGGEYTRASNLWLHANGAVLPLIISFVYLLFYNKERTNTFYRVVSFFAGIVPITSLLTWVIIPFVYVKGSAPASDDVTQFLTSFSEIADPLIVSAAALILFGLGIVILLKKGVFQNYVHELKDASKKKQQ